MIAIGWTADSELEATTVTADSELEATTVTADSELEATTVTADKIHDKPRHQRSWAVPLDSDQSR